MPYMQPMAPLKFHVIMVYIYIYIYIYISYSIILYSRDHQGVGVAYEKASPKNQPHFSLTMMKQYWLSPNKLSDQPKMLSTSCYGIFKTIYFLLTEELTE